VAHRVEFEILDEKLVRLLLN